MIQFVTPLENNHYENDVDHLQQCTKSLTDVCQIDLPHFMDFALWFIAREEAGGGGGWLYKWKLGNFSTLWKVLTKY